MAINPTTLPTTIVAGRTGFLADVAAAWAQLNAITALLSGTSSTDASSVRTALSVPPISALTATPLIVKWVPGTGWGTYDMDPNKVREFLSQNDVAATAPTKGSDQDRWFRHRDAT